MFVSSEGALIAIAPYGYPWQPLFNRRIKPKLQYLATLETGYMGPMLKRWWLPMVIKSSTSDSFSLKIDRQFAISASDRDSNLH